MESTHRSGDRLSFLTESCYDHKNWPKCLLSKNKAYLVNMLTRLLSWSKIVKNVLTYRKVASSSLSWLVAHFQIFRRFIKGKFDAYIM